MALCLNDPLSGAKRSVHSEPQVQVRKSSSSVLVDIIENSSS